MLSRLPISLAQLKAENNSKNLKMKLDNYCILRTDQKKKYKTVLWKFDIISRWKQFLKWVNHTDFD